MRSRYDGVITITSAMAAASVFGFLGGVVADTVVVPIAAIAFLLAGAVVCLATSGASAANHHVQQRNKDNERLPMTDHASTGSYARVIQFTA